MFIKCSINCVLLCVHRSWTSPEEVSRKEAGIIHRWSLHPKWSPGAPPLNMEAVQLLHEESFHSCPLSDWVCFQKASETLFTAETRVIEANLRRKWGTPLSPHWEKFRVRARASVTAFSTGASERFTLPVSQSQIPRSCHSYTNRF